MSFQGCFTEGPFCRLNPGNAFWPSILEQVCASAVAHARAVVLLLVLHLMTHLLNQHLQGWGLHIRWRSTVLEGTTSHGDLSQKKSLDRSKASPLGKAQRQDSVSVLLELLHFAHALEISEILELPGSHLQTWAPG